MGRGGAAGAGRGPLAWAGALAGALALALAQAGAGAGAEGGTWDGVAGSDLRSVPVPLPGGGTADVQYWGVPRVLSARVPGVLDFELFPPVGAQAMVDTAEAWSAHEHGWSQTLDTVDRIPEWQIYFNDPWAPPLHADTEVDPDSENAGLKAAMMPLMKKICLEMLPEFLKTHRSRVVAGDECTMIFLRKYRAGVRAAFPAHQDMSIFTLNVALSDYRDVQGGELFVCRQLPQSFAKVLTTGWFFSLAFPDSRIVAATASDTCSRAQGSQGHAISAYGGRLHGVLPTQEGTRYSIIFFIGAKNVIDNMGQEDLVLENGQTASSLGEPFGEAHVADMAERDVIAWLTHMAALSTRVGLGLLSFDKFPRDFQDTLIDGTHTYAMHDIVLALKYFYGSADITSLAFRSMHAMLVGGGGMPTDTYREIAAKAGAAELTLRGIAAHPERFDIGQLGCAVWESLACGGQEGEDCEGRPEECEDPDLWGPQEIDPALHGTRTFESEDFSELLGACQEAKKNDEIASTDCFLLYAWNSIVEQERISERGDEL